jgi:uncharacterized protein (DUF2267 family)
MDTIPCVADIANQLGCSHQRAEAILRSVMCALRDGLDDREAATIESSLPANFRAVWPATAGRHPGLADLGDVGFLGRVQELALSPSDDETKRMVHIVMASLMVAMAIPGGDRRAAWSALMHLPRESKLVWMKLFRAACFPVEWYASDP